VRDFLGGGLAATDVLTRASDGTPQLAGLNLIAPHLLFEVGLVEGEQLLELGVLRRELRLRDDNFPALVTAHLDELADERHYSQLGQVAEHIVAQQ